MARPVEARVRATGLRRALALLPTGTLVTAVGVTVLGFASYVYLAIAGHTLSIGARDNVSVLWSVVFSVGNGLFLPVEQVITRAVAARRARGIGTRPLWRRSGWLTLVVALSMVVVMAAASPVLVPHLFHGEWGIMVATLGGLVGVAVAAPVRGQAAGMGRFDLYARQAALDGVLRIGLALGCGLIGVRSATAYGLILLVAPVLATGVLARRIGRTATAGPPATVAEVGHGLWPLVVAALLGQFMLNSVIVSATVLAPDATALTTALLDALVLIRIPQLVFGAMQGSLLSGLAIAAAAGDRAGHRRLMGRGLGVITTLMAGFAIPMIAVGPWLIEVLFAAPPVLGRADFAILSAGTWFLLAAMALGQGVMSLHRNRAQMVAYILGAVALVLVAAIPAPVQDRLEWAYLAGNAVVAAGLMAFLLATGGRPAGGPRPAGRPRPSSGTVESSRFASEREDPR